jgi:RNA polymerase sigma-70 factor (ECF subfamily)
MDQVTRWEDRNDETLLAFIREGHAHAFAVLVERHSQRFYRLAYRFMTDTQMAEDIVQEAFLKLWQNPAAWQPGKNTLFTTWFYRVVTNLCLDAKRRKRPDALKDDVPAREEGAEDQDVLQHEQHRALEREIAALPERQRTALNLCFYEELSNREAADVMGLSEKALQSLIMRAKATLKKRLVGYA